MTKKNQAILDLVREAPVHMTAEEVFLLCKERGIEVSVASVYRILDKLALDGEIRRLSGVNGGPDRFDRNIMDHVHMVCVKCGKILDMELPGLKEEIENQAKTSIEHYDLCVRYVCSACR